MIKDTDGSEIKKIIMIYRANSVVRSLLVMVFDHCDRIFNKICLYQSQKLNQINTTKALYCSQEEGLIKILER